MFLRNVFIVIFFVLNSPLLAATIYVDATPGGNCSGNYSIANKNCTGSDGYSYTTIQAAVNAHSSGDTIYIRTGTYTERVGLSGGAQNTAWTNLWAFTGESPILDGGGSNVVGISSGMYDGQNDLVRNYWYIKGLEIRNYGGSTGGGIRFNNSTTGTTDPNAVGTEYLKIEDCIIHDNQTYGIKIGGGGVSGTKTHDITILNNTVYSNGSSCASTSDHGIKMDGAASGHPTDQTQSHTILIHGNTVYENNAHGIYSSTGNYDITVTGNTSYDNCRVGIGFNENWNVTATNNLVYGNGTHSSGWRYGMLSNLSDNANFSYNYVYDNLYSGISIVGEHASLSTQNYVIGNIIYENNKDTASSEQAGIVIETTTKTYVHNNTVVNNNIVANSNGKEIYITTDDGHQIKNNIFADTGADNGQPIIRCASGASWTADDINYNIYYTPSVATEFLWGSTTYSFDDWKTNSLMDTNSTEENPGFTAQGSDDYTLTGVISGRASGTGYDTCLDSSSTFGAGGTVVTDTCDSIGAYVYGSEDSTIIKKIMNYFRRLRGDNGIPQDNQAAYQNALAKVQEHLAQRP